MRETLRLPRIVFPEPTWKRLMAYVLACPLEIGGLGTVRVREDALTVEEVFLLEQEVTGATTHLDPGAVGRFVARFAAEGRDPSLLRFWWHSHASMDVFWSATDIATIRDLSEEGFLLSLVGNHKGETRVSLALRRPFGVFADDLPFRIEPQLDSALVNEVRDEVRAKVTEAVPGIFRTRRRPVEPPAIGEPPSGEGARYRKLRSGADVAPVELRDREEKVS